MGTEVTVDIRMILPHEMQYVLLVEGAGGVSFLDGRLDFDRELILLALLRARCSGENEGV